jgi:hypothetical protein
MSTSGPSLTYVAPISGQYFPLQLAAIYRISREVPLVPDLILASSGGTIASVTALAGNWQPAGILNTSGLISSDKVFERSTLLPFDAVNWFITGTVVRPVSRIYSLGRKLLTGRLAGPTEFVIGAFDRDTRKLDLFTNRPVGQSYVVGNDSTGQTISPVVGYSYGTDTDMCMRAMLASCAIPNFIPPVRIRSDSPTLYQDGGLYSPSPWSSLSHLWLRYTNPMKLICFVSTLELPVSSTDIVRPLYDMVYTSCTKEYEMIAEVFISRNPNAQMSKTSNFAEAMQIFQGARECVLFVIPHTKHTHYFFNIANFTGAQVNQIVESFNAFTLRLYHV